MLKISHRGVMAPFPEKRKKSGEVGWEKARWGQALKILATK